MTPPSSTGLFQSFFLGGFECSTHRLRNGKRLDIIAATRHDEFAARDYRRLQSLGIFTARDGIRWHLIERTPGKYDFSSALPMLRAARETDMQVIWDVWHYGWPDDLDIFSQEFVDRFAAFAAAFATIASNESSEPLFLSPINEISFFSWAGGEGGAFNPFALGRGNEMKVQLVRASLAGIDAIRAVNPKTRLAQIDPMINVIADAARPDDAPLAESYRQSQFEAWDMISGRSHPELGGGPGYLDILGVNYYIHNQWIYPGGHGTVIEPSDVRYRHVRDMVQEIYERYRRPIFIAETGIEDEVRPGWLRYMCNEVIAALDASIPLEGVCLYPIVNHPGWDDDRHCYNGLFDYPDATGERAVYQPLADELARQQELIKKLRQGEPIYGAAEWDRAAFDTATHVMEQRTDNSR